ncbi:amidohydrolase [Chitinophaga sp. sic0106]|uniref:amidohydrolase family protein n=1 Tax=Chitinophaga sp. sic0106 TaxID=2854785 RepID=UPI001C485B47|nr:amidohydrolase family protein [Chitinophaga sp. sic0106]MBV7531242.1 amidohydrolase family protein [Chitinophaga sp. sic0106]
MIIDAHQHFWKYDPVKDAWIDDTMEVIRKDFFPEQLLPMLQAHHFHGCVAVQADQSEKETAFLLDLANKHDFIKGVVGWVDLCSPDIEARLAHYAQFPRLKGFRHIVQGEPDPMFLLRDDFCRGILALAQYDFTYDILVYPKQLPAVVEFVKKFPNQRLVIDHLAKPDFKSGDIETWAAQMREIAASPNVYCKVSGLVTEADWENWHPDHFQPFLEVVLEAFGCDRLMFGSDWPVCLLAADYDTVKLIVTNYISKLTPAEQQKIMGGNAIAFYHL